VELHEKAAEGGKRVVGKNFLPLARGSPDRGKGKKKEEKKGRGRSKKGMKTIKADRRSRNPASPVCP